MMHAAGKQLGGAENRTSTGFFRRCGLASLRGRTAWWLVACCAVMTSARAQEVLPEANRMELTGQLLGLGPQGMVVNTPMGPVSIAVTNPMANPAIAPLGGLPGLDQLFQPLGGAPGLAPVPTEWQIRVTTSLDVIQSNDVLRFQSELQPRTGIPVKPLTVLELYPQGVGSERKAQAGDDEPPWTDVLVDRRQGRELMVRNGPRRQALPVDRNVVVRFTTADTRWLSIGDRVDIVARRSPNGMMQASRVRVEHLDPRVNPERIPADNDMLLALSRGEVPAAAGVGAVGGAEGGEPVDGAAPIRPMPRRAAMADGEAPVADEASRDERSEVPESPLGNGGRAFGRRIRIN